jgi:hypothetical protein
MEATYRKTSAKSSDKDPDNDTDNDSDNELDNDSDADLLALAVERFKQAYQAEKDDWDSFRQVEDFLAHDQWPNEIKQARQSAGRPCLTLDHLNKYVRHVINAGLMRSRDVRVMPMSGEADDEVGDKLAGLIRQILQTSSSKISYERGLRHSCGKGKGYWKVKVVDIEGTDLQEIQVRPIRDPRMVLCDPTCEYPDARDGRFVFELKKLSQRDFKAQFPDAYEDGGCQSWHNVDKNTVLPFIDGDPVVVATYYYKKEDGTLCWAILVPNKVLDKGEHQGNLPPIIRCIGEEYEYQGKERTRGLVNPSSMDAQRAYNYSGSACIEQAALAPLAPFVAAEGQTEEFPEWKDAHKVSRAVLRYKPVSLGGVLAPPPTRQEPAQLSPGWSGMMQQLMADEQSIMGIAQPNVLGTGGIPVQSGAGIDAQKEPGDINTYHYHEHWFDSIEQTGRVIMAMIPHVYNQKQAVMIVGNEGEMEKVVLDPQQQAPVQEIQKQVRSAIGFKKVMDKTYNHLLGRYDVAISTGPSSATKKAETSQLMQTMVQAYPQLMEIAGDLVVRSMDMAGADMLADRLKKALPPGLAEDDDDVAGLVQKLKQAAMQVQQLQEQNAEMEKLILAEQQKAQMKLIEADKRHAADLEKEQIKAHRDLINAQLDSEANERLQAQKIQAESQINSENNVVKLIIARIQSKDKIDVELLKHFSAIQQIESHADRMAGYGEIQNQLNANDAAPAAEVPS